MTAISDCRDEVFARQGGVCIAPLLDSDSGPCFDRWGDPWTVFAGLELDRIRDHATAGKAPSHSDATRNVLGCAGHHRGTGPQAGRAWCLANRPAIRRHLARVNQEKAA